MLGKPVTQVPLDLSEIQFSEKTDSWLELTVGLFQKQRGKRMSPGAGPQDSPGGRPGGWGWEGRTSPGG